MNAQEEKLRQEILGDAQRKAERTRKRARRDAEKNLQSVRDKQQAARTKRLEAAEREAAEKHRAVIAGIEYMIRKRWLLLREEILRELFAAILPEIEAGDGIDRERSLRELLREGLEAIGPAATILRVHPRDLEVLDETARAEEWRAACGDRQGDASPDMQVETDENITGGLILETRDGRNLFDNTYATRLVRLKRMLRAELCADFSADEGKNQDG
jgi:vacuolar-type H+-ATPase subunit E/Vma4